MSFFRKPEYEGKISFTEYISKEKKRWGFYSFHSIVTSLPEILTLCIIATTSEVIITCPCNAVHSELVLYSTSIDW